MADDTPVHNIGVVQRRTGISADLLRAWERRYAAIVPRRTETARRLYSDADLRRLTLLRDAVEAGHRIGHIASLGDDDLLDLVRPPAPQAEEAPGAAIEARLDRAIAAITALDGPRLQAELRLASLDLGRLELVERFLAPLMERIGRDWREGELDPAQEHLATAEVRTFVAAFLAGSAPADAPTVVVTTPSGQRHELGSLLAAATAAAEGWRAVYLGPDLPASSIALAAKRAGADLVAIGVGVAPTAAIVAEVEALRGRLGSTPLVVGGRGASAFGPSEGLVPLGGLASLRELLAGWGSAMRRP